MNIMPNGTGWILPPRCAARYTMGVMWKYGVEKLTYHDMDDPDDDVKSIIMNIRNPFTRIRSWLRLWNTTLEEPLDAAMFIGNLHTQEFQRVQFVNKIENPNDVDHPWKYVIPLTNYMTVLRQCKRKVNYFVRQEHLEDDLAKVGYPIHGNEIVEMPDSPVKNKWEPGDGQLDIDFYANNPFCVDVVRAYYKDDFEILGYSMDPEKLMR